MAMSPIRSDDGLMSELNTTPLIDVMLVLLIMFIITIPIQSHAVKIDLPGGPAPAELLDPIVNKVLVTRDDRILWNGTAVGLQDYRALVTVSLTLPSEPELHLQPEAEARYETVDMLLAETRKAGATKLGFVGNEGFASAF